MKRITHGCTTSWPSPPGETRVGEAEVHLDRQHAHGVQYHNLDEDETAQDELQERQLSQFEAVGVGGVNFDLLYHSLDYSQPGGGH